MDNQILTECHLENGLKLLSRMLQTHYNKKGLVSLLSMNTTVHYGKYMPRVSLLEDVEENIKFIKSFYYVITIIIKLLKFYVTFTER